MSAVIAAAPAVGLSSARPARGRADCPLVGQPENRHLNMVPRIRIRRQGLPPHRALGISEPLNTDPTALCYAELARSQKESAGLAVEGAYASCCPGNAPEQLTNASDGANP